MNEPLLPSVARAGLRHSPLFADLPDDTLAEVALACRFKRYRARQVMITSADVDRDCYIIIAGQVRVVMLSPGGREVSFRDAGVGDMVGEIAALDGQPRSATVIALQDTLVARLSPEDLTTLLRTHWPICERMLLHLAGMGRRLTGRVYELSTLSVQQRLCAELMRLALAAGGTGADRVTISPAPSHSELAARIGSYREQVTRELAELARQGLVERGDKQLTIGDMQALTEHIDVRST